MLEKVATLWFALPGYARSTAWILVITVVLILCVAFLTLWERKVIGWIQLRQGPNRVRIFGLLPGVGQPFADVVKLLLKEVIIPVRANKQLFYSRAGACAHSSVCDLGRDSALARARCRQYRCGTSVCPVADLRRRVRHYSRRLGDQFEVCVPGRDALGRADRCL